MAEVKLQTHDPYNPEVVVDLPGNSTLHTGSDNRTKKTPIKQVTKGKVLRRKEPLSKKISNSLFGGNVSEVRAYLVSDVIIPGIKNLIYDMFLDGLGIAMFGESQRRTSDKRYSGGGSRVNYGNYSKTGTRERREVRAPSRRYSFDEVILASRGDAEEVLDTLCDRIEDYGEATVGDLNDMLGVTGPFTDQYWGWRNLSSATIKRAREGFLLDLPNPENLKKGD